MEVTVRTADSCFLLRPGRELNQIFAGCLGRAQALNPVRLHAVIVASNHFHLLLSPEDSLQMARFMHHLNTNLSKRVGRLLGRSGPIFGSRYAAIPVSNEPEAQQARLRYLLSHGAKESLVASPRDWPGIHSATALIEGKTLDGVWIDRTSYWQARNRGEDVEPAEFGIEYQVELEPLPCWAHLGEEVWRSHVRSMVADIEEETRARHQSQGTRPAGVRAVLRRLPFDRPEKSKRSPRPRCHAFTRAVRAELNTGWAEFVTAYRAAADLLRHAKTRVRFPPDCFPPCLPYVPPT